MKKLTYLFPSGSPNKLKIFEDSTSTIRGHYFTRKSYEQLKEYDNIDSPCIYFLLYVDSENLGHVYIGQSIKGIYDIDTNNGNWTEGYLFNTTNSSFNKVVNDYLQYHYIDIFKGTKHIVENLGINTKPVVGIYEEPDIKEYIRQLDFLLLANGINIHQETMIEPEYKIYENKNYNAKLKVENEKFILLKNSEIKRPNENTKDYKDNNFYERNNKKIEELFEKNLVIEKGDKLIIVDDVEYHNSNYSAELVVGRSVSGPKFWKIDSKN